MMKKLLLASFLALVSAPVLFAQITTSAITGLVVDSKGEAIPGANVVATHTPSGTTYGTTTQADGRYRINGMRVGGPYTVKISFLGFKEQNVENIFINLNVATDINATLVDEATQLQDVVVTSSRSDIFSTDRNGAAASYGTGLINSVPTIGRKVDDIIKYNAFGNGSSFAGQDTRYNNFTIDGSVFNNGFGLGTQAAAGGRTGTTPVSLDAYDEIQLNVAPFDVRQSGFAGANINAVTRSGTNQITGSVYMLSRGSGLVGKKVDGQSISNVNVNEKTYGFRIGAPIIKNKLFIFANYEQFNSSTPALQFTANRGSSGNSVSRTTLADLQTLSDFMDKNLGWKAGALDGYNNEISSRKGLIRLDYNISNDHKLSVRYSQHDSWADQSINNSTGGGLAGFGNRQGYPTGNYSGQGALSPFGTNYRINDNTQSVAVELNSNFNGKFSNKLIGTYNHQNEDRDYHGQPLFPTIEIQDGAGYSGSGNYVKGVSTYTSLGMDPFTPNNKLRYSTLNITDNITYFQGDHTLTAGLSFEHFRSDNLFFAESRGVYVYNSIEHFTDAVNEYLANPNATTTAYAPVRYNLRYSLLPNAAAPWQIMKVNTYSFYVQDEYQMNAKFKLTAGIRGDVFAYDNSLAKAFYNPTVASLSFRDENGAPYAVNTGAFPKAKLLLSPRIGFNYDVKGDRTTQLRGGTGIFVSRIPEVLVSNQLGTNGINTNVITVNNSTAYPFRTNPFDLPAAVAPPSNPTAADIAKVAPGTINATDPNLKFPMIWKTDVAIDQRLPYGFIGTFEVLYNKTLQGIRYIDANLQSSNGNLVGPDNRPTFPGIYYNSAVTNVYVLKNTTKGDAYTITLKLEKPVTKGLGGMLAYTYGRSRDLQSVASTVLSNTPTPSWQNALPLSYADNDVRHRIVGYVNYKITYGGEYGGSTMVTLGMVSNSGAKFSYTSGPTSGASLNNDRQNNDLIYVPKQASDLSFQPATLNGTLYTAAQQQAAYDDFINRDPYLKHRRGLYAERNGAYFPWLTRFDISIVQEFYMKVGGQKHTLQLRGDILNFGNLISDKAGATFTARATQPVTFTGTVGGVPQYTLNPAIITNTSPYIKSVNINNAWQAQLGIRYIFN